MWIVIVLVAVVVFVAASDRPKLDGVYGEIRHQGGCMYEFEANDGRKIELQQTDCALDTDMGGAD
jgi:hypothetical protein